MTEASTTQHKEQQWLHGLGFGGFRALGQADNQINLRYNNTQFKVPQKPIRGTAKPIQGKKKQQNQFKVYPGAKPIQGTTKPIQATKIQFKA